MRTITADAISIARRGEQVLVLANTQPEVHDLFCEGIESAIDAIRLVRSPGSGRIQFDGGGRIFYQSVRGSGRGLSVGAVLCAPGTDLPGDTEPALAAVTGGRIVRYLS